jgi:hypothetical protein
VRPRRSVNRVSHRRSPFDKVRAAEGCRTSAFRGRDCSRVFFVRAGSHVPTADGSLHCGLPHRSEIERDESSCAQRVSNPESCCLNELLLLQTRSGLGGCTLDPGHFRRLVVGASRTPQKRRHSCVSFSEEQQQPRKLQIRVTVQQYRAKVDGGR